MNNYSNSNTNFNSDLVNKNDNDNKSNAKTYLNSTLSLSSNSTNNTEENNNTNILESQNKTYYNDFNNTIFDNSTNNYNLSITLTPNNKIETINLKLNSTIEKSQKAKKENCIDKDFVPSEVIMKKVKAYEKSIRANDLKVISTESQSKEMDKELPDSESSRQRKELDDKFQSWKKLYNKSLKDKSLKQATYFMQMKLLEKTLADNKYKPYLQFMQLHERVKKTASVEKVKNKTKNFLKRKQH